MNSIRKCFAGIGVATFALGLAATANARSTSAWAGRPQVAGDLGCFTESRGAVTNNGSCGSGALEWVMNLPVDAAGVYTATVNVTVNSGTPTSAVGCQMFGFSQNPNSSYSSSGPVAFPEYTGTNENLSVTLQGSGVPSAGVLYLYCNLAPGASINTVNWNQ